MPEASHEIKLICFDLNKTLIRENTWRDLNLALGMTPSEDDLLMAWYNQGVIDYAQGQAIIERIYKTRGRASRSNIQRIISRYTYLPSAHEAVAGLKAQGYEVALLSGSIDLLVKSVADDLRIELWGANNSFIFDEAGILESISVQGTDEEVKLEQLSGFCTRLGIELHQCVCVGDGDNDRTIFEATGHSITFRGSKIENSAWKVIDSLADLLKSLPKV